MLPRLRLREPKYASYLRRLQDVYDFRPGQKGLKYLSRHEFDAIVRSEAEAGATLVGILQREIRLRFMGLFRRTDIY